jgi:hypothetical protein
MAGLGMRPAYLREIVAFGPVLSLRKGSRELEE